MCSSAVLSSLQSHSYYCTLSNHTLLYQHWHTPNHTSTYSNQFHKHPNNKGLVSENLKMSHSGKCRETEEQLPFFVLQVRFRVTEWYMAMRVPVDCLQKCNSWIVHEPSTFLKAIFLSTEITHIPRQINCRRQPMCDENWNGGISNRTRCLNHGIALIVVPCDF